MYSADMIYFPLLIGVRIYVHKRVNLQRERSSGDKDSHRDQAFEESKLMRNAIAKSDSQDIIAIKRLIRLKEITTNSATQ